MRTTLFHSAVAVLAALSICACSSSRNNSSDQSATSSETAAASAAPASSAPAAEAPAAGKPGSIPMYPGAEAAANPGGLGMKALPPSAKVYSTSDDFAKVKTWYQGQLKGAPEMAQPGKEKTMDAFLVGHGPGGFVVMIQSLNGKTWIVIAPPM
jgi:hypothetical protein